MKPAEVLSGFWRERLEVNARRAIFHQWEQLVKAGCIENFRIVAGEVSGFREGWFFADSDAYKWLDAAARINRGQPDERLTRLMDDFIALLGRAQAPNGYIFTYNQIFFPGERWRNLKIEHELYCHGHLIEAGVSHAEATGRADLLDIARKAADRVVADFHSKGPAFTPGHEEIEIALLRLYQLTGQAAYLDQARQFIEQRGREPLFALSLFRQNAAVNRRKEMIQKQRAEYLAAHPHFKPFQLPPNNPAVEPPWIKLRYTANALSGKYFQQHAPVRRQTVPEGHAVRFAYFETAAAMLARLSGDRTLLPALEHCWEHLLLHRMCVTGGIGSLPMTEGFGRDDELDPEFAYNETCAALGSMFWNWEMARLTGRARYCELFEWQLYNASAVGMGLHGDTYLYNNPLTCRGNMLRQPWYAVPCCPSNLSRTWADLGGYIYTAGPGVLRLHQYIGSRFTWHAPQENGATVPVTVEMESGLPWQGKVRVEIDPGQPLSFALQFRRPAWAGGMHVHINGALVEPEIEPDTEEREIPSAGFDPRRAVFCTLQREWCGGDVVEIEFELPITARRAGPRVKGQAGKIAVTRGPLVYCLETVDNPDMDIFTAALDPALLTEVHDPDLLGGVVRLSGPTRAGGRVTLIPYFLWGNRGPSQMTVWLNE